MRTLVVALLSVALAACPGAPVSPTPPPGPAPDTDACTLMCARIGPTGLNCPEGADVYDSSQPPLPGHKLGDPNISCVEFCQQEQTNGLWLNPKCVAKVAKCADIEAARKNTCP
jgi:hypothetical protein